MQVPIRKAGKYTQSKPDFAITPAKLAELKQQLERLLSSRTKQAAEVKVLSEGGDYSENAGYSAAKGKLRGMNERILALEEQIKNAQVISSTGDNSRVRLGHKVTVEIHGQQKTFTILGSTETDPAAGIISHQSPIGAALLGHSVGEVVHYQSANQMVDCRILAIE